MSKLKYQLQRGLVASTSGALMMTGAYPVLPHIEMMWTRWRRDRTCMKGQISALGVEWLVSLGMTIARPLSMVPIPVTTRKKRGKRPIIVVHGYMMSRANFLPMGRRLARAGLGPVFGFDYWSLGPISDAALRLSEFVETLCKRTGADSVDIIGHSQGGVVSRYYVAMCGGNARVKNLITLGSPHRGTKYSHISIGEPLREMTPDSEFLQRLNHTPFPPDVNLTVIWSKSDALVPDADVARISDGDEVVYDDIGHMTLLVSPRVLDEVIVRLGGTVATTSASAIAA